MAQGSTTNPDDRNILPFSPLGKMVEDFCIRQDKEKQILAERHAHELNSFLQAKYTNLTINDFIRIFSRNGFSINVNLFEICVVHFFEKSLTERHNKGIILCINIIYHWRNNIPETSNLFGDLELTEDEKKEIRSFLLSHKVDSGLAFQCEDIFPWLKTERKLSKERQNVTGSINRILELFSGNTMDLSDILMTLDTIFGGNIKLKESSYKNITKKIINYLIKTKDTNFIVPPGDNLYLKMIYNFNELINYSWNKKIMDYIDFYAEYQEKIGETSEVLGFIQKKINQFQQNEIDTLSQEELERIRKLGIVIQSVEK